MIERKNSDAPRRVTLTDLKVYLEQAGWLRLPTRESRWTTFELTAVGAKGVQLPAFVQKRDLGQVKVQMAGAGRQIHRFQRTARLLLDHIQALAQAQEVLHVLKGCHPGGPGPDP